MKKNNLLSMTILLLVSSSAFANGGAIGGGEVTQYPLFKCSAIPVKAKLNAAVRFLVVSGEKDFDGNLNPEMSVTISLQDAKGDTLNYLPTNTLPNNFMPQELIAFEYADSFIGQLNRPTSKLQVNGTEGYLLPSTTLKVVDMLRLKNCEYIASTNW